MVKSILPHNFTIYFAHAATKRMLIDISVLILNVRSSKFFFYFLIVFSFFFVSPSKFMVIPIFDIGFGHIIVALFHEHLLNDVLNLLYLNLVGILVLDSETYTVKHICVWAGNSTHFLEGLVNRLINLSLIKVNLAAITFDYLHAITILFSSFFGTIL